MAYLGPKPSQTLATPTSQYFNGTGSQTVFTLNRAVNVSEDLEVFVNNIQQEPGVGKSYTASGTTLTFDAAPSSGTANVYVVYRGLAEVTTRLEHDANSALAATTGTFSGSVTADGVHSEYNGVSDNMTTSPTASGVQIGSFTNGYSAVEIAGTSGGFIDFSSADGTDFDGRILYAHSNDSMKFYTSGTTERLRIDSSGNVSIGGTAPVTPLTITTENKLGSTFTGNINGEGLTVTQTNYTDGNYISLVEAAYDDSGAANPNVRIGAKFTGAGSSLAFGTSNNYSVGINNTAMTINYEGNVGIGSSSPEALLHVEGASTGQMMFRTSGSSVNKWLIGKNSSSDFSIGEDGNEWLYVQRDSGNVGIGITTPDSEPRLHVRKGDAGGVDSATNSVLTIENSTTAILQFLTPNTASQQIRFGDPQDTGAGFIQYSHSLNAIQFGTNGPEKMRLDVNGKLLLNTTSTSYGGQFTARQTDGINVAAIACVNTASSGTRRLIDFFTGTSTSRKGSIESDGTNTSYNTTSDYRLKENVTADWDATTRLKQLNPVRFNFIENADKTVDGFLAHEVQDIVPEAITGTKDGMRDEEYEVTPAVEATYDDEGNVLTEEVPAVMGTRSVPDYQGIDQAKLVPLLVKTIQELEARIAALEAN